MGRTVVVEVTAEDIAAGVPSNCRSCPIAVAIKRHGFNNPWVDNSRLCFGQSEVRPPRAAREFMEEFDAGIDVKPFAFTVELP